MNEKMKTLQLKKSNHDYPVVLIYNKCKSGESQYGPWCLYSVVHNRETQGIFAKDSLHKQLQQYGKGAKLIIRWNQDHNGRIEWRVKPANGNTKRNSNLTYQDARTRDIHRQVALKIATISLGQTNKPWVDEDLREIKVRMDNLPIILDGYISDD